MTFITNSLNETKILASSFVLGLEDGALILAYGDLAAGKTAFAKGIGKALKIKEDIDSPTFNILKVYQGTKTFYHMDAYRLENQANIDIGIEDFIGESNSLTYIEWPMYIDEYLKNLKCPIYEVRLERLSKNRRKIEIIKR